MFVWDPNLSQQAEGKSCLELRSHTPAAGSLHRPWELRTGGQEDRGTKTRIRTNYRVNFEGEMTKAAVSTLTLRER